MQAIVLAAVGGPEFGPLCQVASKAMIPFLGQPLLARVIQWLERHDAREITVSLRQRPYPIESYFHKHPPAQARVTFQLDHERVGTAGAVKKAVSSARGTVVVAQGALVTDVDLEAAFTAHKAKGALVTLVVVPGDRTARAGRVSIADDGRVTAIEEHSQDQSRPASAGIYLIEPEALVHAQEGADFALDFFPDLIAKRLPVFAFETRTYWMDAGQPGGYMQALTDALHGRIPGVVPSGSEIKPGVWVEPGATIHPKAKLCAPCWVGAGARLKLEAQVGPVAAVEGGAELARGASIVSGAVLPGAFVGKATSWEGALLYPDGWIDLAAYPPQAHASADPDVLGTTWAEPARERLHTGFDQAVAAIGLFAIAPLLLLLWVAIKLDSPGPAFYTQLRVGRDRRPYRHGLPRGEIFECFKFRTMRVDADQKVQALMAQNAYGSGAFFKLAHDPRITRIGHLLRKSSLDELPQLFNVLRGEMRLVGCRPLPVYEAEALQADWQRTRFLAPAGITGLWQISGRSDLSEKERLALDAYYSVTRTFGGDLAILLKTFPALLLRRGAR